ncbi:MAG TPA: hypothetical protein GX692_04175 [Acholeplasmataceae bacterium]|jgi:hypothetical protein|nr:hypothetical protein [Acholeplasmataceae bacterium]
MKTSKNIIITTLILFLLDFILTLYFLNNSSYVSEGNPLVYTDYGYIVLVINLVYMITIVFLSKIIEKYKTVILKSKGTLDYIKQLYKSNHISFIFVSLAFSFVNATLVSRLVVVVDWVIFGIYENTFYSTTYFKIRDFMPFGRYDILIGVLSFFIFIPIWYRLEFKKSITLV